MEVQRSLAAGSVMMSSLIWLSRQHLITNEGQGGVAGREGVDEELERNSDKNCHNNHHCVSKNGIS